LQFLPEFRCGSLGRGHGGLRGWFGF
jgi:hypothetical protein